jgi:Protein of unknown function (DUF1631)
VATRASPDHTASQARRLYTEELVKGLTPLVQAVMDSARVLLDKPSEHAVFQRRRDLMQGLMTGAQAWHRGIVSGLRQLLAQPPSASGKTSHSPSALLSLSSVSGRDTLTLVPDDTIELEIVTSRLALAIMDRASWEFADLRSRVAHLEARNELDSNDMLRAHVLARVVFDAWRAASFTLEGWREMQATLHEEFALLVEESYHEANRWLASQGVLAEVDLRPLIRRSRTHPNAPMGWQAGMGQQGMGSQSGPQSGSQSGAGRGSQFGSQFSSQFGNGAGRDEGPASIGLPSSSVYSTVALAGSAPPGRDQSHWQNSTTGAGVGQETRMMTRAAPLARSREHAEAVLGRLNRLIGRHVPEFGSTTHAGHLSRPGNVLSVGLAKAIDFAEQGIRQRLSPASPGGSQAGSQIGSPGGSQTGSQGGVAMVTTPVLLEELQQRKQVLKKAAATPEERATIEIVALLFQSILTEDRIPASVRVWFARLQMPVLRVAVTEPDFFATIDHPARRLIDRMGACVMGFDSASSSLTASLPVGASSGASGSGGAGPADGGLEKEVKRIVQVVEAYPDTGRRVFQTVLTEFEKFLEHYFKNQNETTKRGVSLAQQVEQRETLAIQYTIELRRMLNEVPVQEGVRQYLFHVWADVLATTAVRYGAQGAQTRTMKRAAADLIWSASAKVTRDERAEVIRRLPPLLKSLREGMVSAGMDAAKQEEHIQQLNNSLAAAFTAKAAVIPDDRLRELMERLETLEELLPDAKDVEIDESMVLDLSGHQSSELEVVLDGGSLPTPAMVAWARELQVGSWYMLERNGHSEPVQLSWQGMRNQLSLFVTPQARCVLFQQHRLASYLQAGLLLPAQNEALTVRATRSALAKLDVDASRLLN